VRTTLRRRFYLESAATLISGVLLVVTLLRPDWLELVFRIDPDDGSGMVEWAITAGFLILTVAGAIAARIEWHRSLAFQRGSAG
jgi:hypothetical protein